MTTGERVKKLTGYECEYRLGVGNLRVLFTFENDIITINEIRPRGLEKQPFPKLKKMSATLPIRWLNPYVGNTMSTTITLYMKKGKCSQIFRKPFLMNYVRNTV